MDWNEFIFGKLKDFIQPNWVVVDVGAHHGTYTEFFYKSLNQTGKIYAFELNADNFKILKNQMLGLSNVVLEHCAVSDVDGDIDFYVGETTYQHNIIGHDTNHKENPKGGIVKSITLDSYFVNVPHIDFLKMDIEGAELRALHGMTETLKKTDYILMECHLDETWEETRSILLNDFVCKNLYNDEYINFSSPRSYQVFCRNNRISE